MLTKTNIEYGTHAWNFYPGCLHKPQGKCPVAACWAEGMSKRQREDFHAPHLIPERLLDPLRRKKPARILVNFMGDLFGDWVNPMMDVLPNFPCAYEEEDDSETLQHFVMHVINDSPQHTFLFLTKNPAGIWPAEWPNNCWMGATAWNQQSVDNACRSLLKVEALNTWLSLEPLLGHIDLKPYLGTFSIPGGSWYEDQWGIERYDLTGAPLAGISWVVIGAQTRPDRLPERIWVEEIMGACQQAGIPYWLKNNLQPLFGGKLRQDTPREWGFSGRGA